MAGSLFVVATPIGNLDDLSPRATRTLRDVALIACEDTRRTGALLAKLAVRTPLTSFFEHNERIKTTRILETLAAGSDVALVSDAGTPAISDPGFRLVRAAREAGFAVVPIPGPTAAIAALAVSGLPTDRFLFVGFLPARAKPRRDAIGELAEVAATLVIYESPLRVVETLSDLADRLGDRDAFLCREATKLHEEYLRAPLAELHRRLAARVAVKGEVTLVVAGASAQPATPAEPIEERYARLRAESLSRREAAKVLAREYGLSAREVYRRFLDR